jgi:class 3 adenylate cyclase/tetratricopeptide (TPR) repeat protein
VVFCDLVGFTQRAETLDPEDVEAFLDPYHRRLRSELEHYGGTVEKFIGDAVMALFGAPTAHEDDPERAVRAALAIRDWALDNGHVQVRLGVTTGEAVIRLEAKPEAGEAMASGDVVNTAARLQAAASVNAVLVDETTYRATRHVIDHEQVDPVDAKGKADTIAVWQPRSARTRFGVDVAHVARAELVGRERELAVLRDVFERAVHGRTPQLVTLVGVPGIGKSRLVFELSQIAREDPELITWRQGRCLAYGDGVTLWALGEIVKAQLGILEQDSPADVAEKARASVDALVDEKDARWVELHLLALVGVAEESELGGDRRGEAFAAWRRFLEGLAELRPLVVVFEDLHWADESLLDFVDELVDWLIDVPLLVVGTARPELLEERPGWGGGKLNATTLALAPLSDEQTARLISALIDRPVLPAESQQALLERAGGNPLYAEQFADLYLERGSTEELSLPETLQGIIAARLDGLPSAEKGLLQDAAVIGKVFWTGGLRREEREAAEALHSLERKGFVRRQRRSSVEGESEFAFAHALVRDVAYGQIPRGERAQKHRHVALWIEALGRTEDHAELLAHHWSAALELAGAAGLETVDLVTPTRLALRAAGDRSFALNAFAEAAAYYDQAVALWPDGDADRADLLLRRARSLQLTADDRSAAALEEARDALLAVGNRETAAEAEVFLSNVWWHRGLRDEAMRHLERAEQLSGSTPSPVTARVLASVARMRGLAGEPAEGLQLAKDALAVAQRLGLDEIRAHSLSTIGTAKNLLGDPTGRAELEKALEIALAVHSPQAGTIYNNLAVADFFELDLRRTATLFDEGLRVAEQFGDGINARWLRGQQPRMRFYLGRWDEALEGSDAFIAECEAGSPHYLETAARETRGLIRLARGDREGALADVRRALALAREAKDPQALMPMLSVNVLALEDLDEHDQVVELAEEVVALGRTYPHAIGWGTAFGVAQSDAVAEFTGELKEILERAPASPWKDLVLVCLERQLVRAAEIWARAGSPTWEAHLRLRAAEALSHAGRVPDAEAQLALALSFYRSVGATFYTRRGEELLAASA